MFVCVLQESQWLDSVSLLIKDSLEGDMIDNLSGSVFHHYCSPPVCKDCKGHSQEVSEITHLRLFHSSQEALICSPVATLNKRCIVH